VAVENVSSYAAFTRLEMTEWEFLTEVVERADCGILLDVNNIYVSAMNHEFDPMDYVNACPPIAWRRFTLPATRVTRKYILDTHDHPVIDPVWQLYARAIERCGPTPTLLEWDDHIPSFDEVHAEAKKAERYLTTRQTTWCWSCTNARNARPVKRALRMKKNPAKKPRCRSCALGQRG
jgi:uncharacterized protein